MRLHQNIRYSHPVAQGGLLARMLGLLQTCDFISAYAALRRGVAPTPVPIIDELKRRMGQ